LAGRVPQQLPVVGGDNHRGSGGPQCDGQLVHEGGRQVVGRLVEEQHVRAPGQYQRQVQPPPGAYRQFGHRPVDVAAVQ